MLTPKDYIGPLMELSQDRRGVFKEMKFITENRASLAYELPLAEVNLYASLLSVICCSETTDLGVWNIIFVDGR